MEWETESLVPTFPIPFSLFLFPIPGSSLWLRASVSVRSVLSWNTFQNASAKDGTTYRVLFCDACAKDYKNGHVRMAKRLQHGPRVIENIDGIPSRPNALFCLTTL